MSVIAVASEPYCSGEDIAARVAERLEYSLVGPELYEAVALQFDISAETVRRAMSGERSFFNAFNREYMRSVVYVKAVLSRMLVQQYFVYHGLGARLIPPDITHVLRVGIVGERDFRIQEAVAAEGWSKRDAERQLQRRDERLAGWARLHLGSGYWESRSYDLMIPRPSTSVDAAVDLVAEAVTHDALLPTDRSVQAQLNFLLATKVSVALVEQGELGHRVTADDGKVVVKTPIGKARRQKALLERVSDLCRKVRGVKEVVVEPIEAPSGTLLVDDEREYVLTLSERLQIRNIESSVAFDGPQALARVAADKPAVMVLDLKMPGMDGLEVLERIRRDHPDVHVIVVTGHGSEQDEERARALGAFDFLRKPVNIATLAERIAEARQLQEPDEQD